MIISFTIFIIVFALTMITVFTTNKLNYLGNVITYNVVSGKVISSQDGSFNMHDIAMVDFGNTGSAWALPESKARKLELTGSSGATSNGTVSGMIKVNIGDDVYVIVPYANYLKNMGSDTTQSIIISGILCVAFLVIGIVLAVLRKKRLNSEDLKPVS